LAHVRQSRVRSLFSILAQVARILAQVARILAQVFLVRATSDTSDDP
jgi:hypothetical protein